MQARMPAASAKLHPPCAHQPGFGALGMLGEARTGVEEAQQRVVLHGRHVDGHRAGTVAWSRVDAVAAAVVIVTAAGT